MHGNGHGTGMIDVSALAEIERGRGFERIDTIPGSTYNDSSTVIVVPTRGMIHYKVAHSWDNLLQPMNQKRAKFYAVGDEVGVAYNKMIQMVLDHPELSKFKYVMTLEDDNVVPPETHLRLLESIEAGPFAAVSGLYFTKGHLNMPMAYGDPKAFNTTGVMDFRPRDVVKALQTGNIMEVNGIGMGCALWRLDLFREFATPWYVTVQGTIPDKGLSCLTQDLYFCERLRRGHKRLAVDLRVRVGHLDAERGVMY